MPLTVNVQETDQQEQEQESQQPDALASVVDGESYVDQLRAQRRRLQSNEKMFGVPGYEVEATGPDGKPHTFHSLQAKYRRLKAAEHRELRANESEDENERALAFNVALLDRACVGIYWQNEHGETQKVADGWNPEIADILGYPVDAPGPLAARMVLTTAVWPDEDDTLLNDHAFAVYAWMLGGRDPLKLLKEDESGNS